MTNDLASWYNKELVSHREVDILRGSTTRGPHHDDIVLTVNGINLRNFGSQGQQRTGVLSLKLSELEFLRSETGEYPILLLDDVMSELDASRRQQLMAYIRRERIQTMITATDAAYFPQERIGTYFYVKAGRITR
jgi:DNA replication and repair protein RecF